MQPHPSVRSGKYTSLAGIRLYHSNCCATSFRSVRKPPCHATKVVVPVVLFLSSSERSPVFDLLSRVSGIVLRKIILLAACCAILRYIYICMYICMVRTSPPGPALRAGSMTSFNNAWQSRSAAYSYSFCTHVS